MPTGTTTFGEAEHTDVHAFAVYVLLFIPHDLALWSMVKCSCEAAKVTIDPTKFRHVVESVLPLRKLKLIKRHGL